MDQHGQQPGVHWLPPPYAENLDQGGPRPGVHRLPPPYAENMDQHGPQPGVHRQPPRYAINKPESSQGMEPLPSGFAPPPPYVINMEKSGPPQGTEQLPPGFVPLSSHTDGHKAPPMQPAGPQVLITQQGGFGRCSRQMTCSYCKAFISTHVKYKYSMNTHLYALLVCLIGCWVCTPCVYYMNCFSVKKHYCPECKAFLGQCYK